MSKSHSQMAKALADSMTISASPGTYGLGPNVTIGSGFLDPNYGAVSTVTLNPGSTYSNTTISATSYPYTISGGDGTNSPWHSNSLSPKIKLDGDGADIEINGISLLKTMQEIQSRLNLLQPNVALEKEWEELFELGKKYRALEQHIKEKQATWDKLKAMPPPTVD